jgi:hypothetical protein
MVVRGMRYRFGGQPFTDVSRFYNERIHKAVCGTHILRCMPQKEGISMYGYGCVTRTVLGMTELRILRFVGVICAQVVLPESYGIDNWS